MAVYHLHSITFLSEVLGSISPCLFCSSSSTFLNRRAENQPGTDDSLLPITPMSPELRAKSDVLAASEIQQNGATGPDLSILPSRGRRHPIPRVHYPNQAPPPSGPVSCGGQPPSRSAGRRLPSLDRQCNRQANILSGGMDLTCLICISVMHLLPAHNLLIMVPCWPTSSEGLRRCSFRQGRPGPPSQLVGCPVPKSRQGSPS